MRTRFAWRMLAAAALALAAGAAAATATSSANMNGFSFTLYDLDLADGIAPMIDFNQMGTGSYIFASVNSAAPDNVYLSSEAFGELPGTPLALSLGTPSGISTAHGRIAGGGDVPTFDSMTVGGFSNSIGTYSGSYAAMAYFPYRGFNSFTLSAHTRVEFCVTGTVNAATTIGLDAAGRVEDAYASVYLGAWERAPGGGLGEGSEASLDVGLYGQFGSMNSASLLKTSLLNATGGTMEAEYIFSVNAGGRSSFEPAPPVPEPATYAMLLPGLALAGALARRRRLSRRA